MEVIHSQSAEMSDEVVASCLYSILLCAAFAGFAAEDEQRLIAIGGPYRLSLFHLRKRLVSLGDISLRQAIQFILEALVISQHMATAVNRFDGRSQRLRLSIEETGLEALVSEPWVPTVTEDRLPTILRLSSDCSLVKQPEQDMFAL